MKTRSPKLEVVTFGEILWDVYETQRGVFVRELGGAPANVAVNLGQVGVKSAVVGGVGRDRFGDDLREFLAQHHVDPRFALRFPNRTGLAFVTRDAHGEPSFLFYRHETADMAMRARDVTPVMGNAHWALIGTSTLVSRPLAASTHAFMQSARNSSAKLVVDLNVRAHLWKDRSGMQNAIASVLKHAVLVKASTADLAALDLGRESKALAWVRSKGKNASIVLTRGSEEATAIGEHGEISVKTKRVKCVDATGAGDAFIAGVLASLLAAESQPGSAAWRDPEIWTRALEVGHILGGVAVSKRGAVSAIADLPKNRLQKIRKRLRRMRKERT